MDTHVRSLPQERRSAEYSDLIPFYVKATYTGRSRPISRKTKDALFSWAQCCAGNPDQFTRTYDTETEFNENGKKFWLATQQRSIADLDSKLIHNQAYDIYLIRVAGRQTEGNGRSVLLVENFFAHPVNRK